jgi:hypothetical protein
MKQPQPDLYSERVIYLAWRFISLPFLIASNVFGWAKGQLLGLQSVQTIRQKDQLRQSRARRELRGLPADHDGGKTSTP